MHTHGRLTGHGLSPRTASGKSKPLFAKGETEAWRKASSRQAAQGREGSLSGVTPCSIPLARRLLHRSSSSRLLSTWFGCSEAHFPPGLLWAPPSFAPSHLLLQLPLTEGYASAEPGDPPLHFHTQKAGTFTPKSRKRGSGPSPSAGLLAHWGTPSPVPRGGCGRTGGGGAPGEPKGSAPPQKHSWPSPAVQDTSPQSSAPPEKTGLLRTEAWGRMLQAHSNAG